MKMIETLAREQFLENVSFLIKFWNDVKRNRARTFTRSVASPEPWDSRNRRIRSRTNRAPIDWRHKHKVNKWSGQKKHSWSPRRAGPGHSATAKICQCRCRPWIYSLLLNRAGHERLLAFSSCCDLWKRGTWNVECRLLTSILCSRACCVPVHFQNPFRHLHHMVYES